MVPVIGILGGVGSGKSSLVRNVSDYRLRIIDADQIGHALLKESAIQHRLRNVFGVDVFDESGGVDRARLAATVFGESPGHRKSLKQLEGILHPEIRKEIEHQIDTVPPDTDAVVIDAALLLEAGWADQCDYLIYVDTPETQRIARVKENRGWTADELHRREQAQLPLEEKRRCSHYVVDNSGTIQDSVRQMTDIFCTIIIN